MIASPSKSGAGTPIRFHIVSYHYADPDSPAWPRVDFLAADLAGRGHSVTIWTRPFDGDRTGGGIQARGVADPLRPSRVKASGAAAPSSSAPWKTRMRGIARKWIRAATFPDPQSFWARRVARRVAAEKERPAMAVTFAAPESAGLVGEALRRRGGKWWFDLADGWTFQGLRYEALASPSRKAREAALEKRWIASADGVSTVNAALRDYFNSLRPSPDVHVFPNVIPREMDLGGASAVCMGGDFLTALYFGRLRKSDAARSLAPLLNQLAADPAQASRVRLLFVGDFDKDDLREIELAGTLCGGVETIPPIPRGRLPELIREKQAGAMLVINSPGLKGSTSKLLDAVGLGMPVWLFGDDDSEAAKITREGRMGVVVRNDAAPIGLAETESTLRRAAAEGFGGRVRSLWSGPARAAELGDLLEAAAVRDTIGDGG
ncbi:MAG: glycosyltransferase [Candidatus Nitrospinota bacterium M3_3B_026]